MKIGIEQKIDGLREALQHIAHFVDLIKRGNPSYVKPLSVELRKLYCEGKGNRLLSRIEKGVGVNAGLV